MIQLIELSFFYELNWSEVTNFQSELTKSRKNLIAYPEALAAIAGVEE